MDEITSFNELFVESARRGLRLNNFFQDVTGGFRCNWRPVAGDPFPFCDHPRPFDAALGALRLACGDKEPPAITAADLFD